MKILLCLEHFHSHVRTASCKQLQNHFSALLQNPSCDACKKPWQCLGYLCTETAVYHVYKYCLISSHTISSACTICCLLWHVQTAISSQQRLTSSTDFFFLCLCSTLHNGCLTTKRAPDAIRTQKIHKINVEIPFYLLNFILTSQGHKREPRVCQSCGLGKAHQGIYMGWSTAANERRWNTHAFGTVRVPKWRER